MSRNYLLVVTISAVLAALLIWTTGIQSALFAPQGNGDQSPGLPRLRLAKTRCDLGSLAKDIPAHASFHVANDGARRLVIRKETGPCCGPGASEVITIIPPGGSADLTIDVEVTGIIGGLQRDITYATNDPQTPRFTLTVVARVEENDH